MIPVTVQQLVVNPENNSFICLLRDTEEERVLPVGVGSFEAQAIALKLGGDRQLPRPLTHDLMASVLDRTGSRVERVSIDDLRDNEFQAHIMLRPGEDGDSVEVEARPSDAIALALRTDSSIFVDEDVMDRGGIQEEMIQETRQDHPRLEALRETLEEAVEAENYEKAARVRDEIQEIQSDIRREAESLDDLEEGLGDRLTRDFRESPRDGTGGGGGD